MTFRLPYSLSSILIGTMTLSIAVSGYSAPLNDTPDLDVQTEAPENKQAKVIANVEPLYILIGGLGLKGDFVINEKWSIGARGTYANGQSETDENSASAYKYDFTYSEWSIGPTFMLSGQINSDGAYLFPSLGYVKAEIDNFSEDKLSGKFESPILRTTVGYQWVNSNNFRFAVGGGLMLVKSNNDIVVKDQQGKQIYKEKYSSSGELALDIQIGMNF